MIKISICIYDFIIFTCNNNLLDLLVGIAVVAWITLFVTRMILAGKCNFSRQFKNCRTLVTFNA